MKLVDMHCDTISALMNRDHSESLKANHLSVDIQKMRKAKSLIQFFACFVYTPDGNWNQAYAEALSMIERIYQEENEELHIAYSYEDIQKNEKAGIISAMMTVEEGGVLNNDMERLAQLYQKGVRLITLTWNHENCLGYPNSTEADIMEKGLKPFGKEVLEQMNNLGMLIDVSHLSDGGFWDCIRYSRAPIVASHSNCRALCKHQRNLTDEMIKALAGKGGVAGLNLYPAFISGDSPCLADIARHARHMIDTGGEDFPAIGTDFDGFETADGLEWITDIGEMDKVWEEFRKAGITERQIDKIQSQNVLRVLQSVKTSQETINFY